MVISPFGHGLLPAIDRMQISYNKAKSFARLLGVCPGVLRPDARFDPTRQGRQAGINALFVRSNSKIYLL